jgi:hypothetical protein
VLSTDDKVARTFLRVLASSLFLLRSCTLEKYAWYKICSSDMFLSNENKADSTVLDICAKTHASHVTEGKLWWATARDPRPSLCNQVLRFASNRSHLVAHPFPARYPNFQTYRFLFYWTTRILPRALLTNKQRSFSNETFISTWYSVLGGWQVDRI